ncbi:hypothetical protein PCANB_000054 [Pneumocystis canis]|nr:hypothetical protein PCK1_000139 [Pneumocystis canis]KAG5439772.1 hypothetical protein PCANB_000054 [Pneumocystis canis]
MTNPRQRKKQKRVKIKKKKKVLRKNLSLPIQYDPVLSKNWEKKQSLEKNYERLGLIAKPNKKRNVSQRECNTNRSLLNKNNTLKLQPNEALIQRDDEGNVIKVIYGKKREFDDSSDNDLEIEENLQQTEAVRELKKRVERGVKIERKLSKNETLFLEKLINRYGDNVDAMAKDIKLNVMQQTAADIQRRIKKLKKGN